jgi:hypothetical protein
MISLEQQAVSLESQKVGRIKIGKNRYSFYGQCQKKCGIKGVSPQKAYRGGKAES